MTAPPKNMPTYVYDKKSNKMVEYRPSNSKPFGIKQKDKSIAEKQADDVKSGYHRMENSGRWTSKYSKNQIKKIWEI